MPVAVLAGDRWHTPAEGTKGYLPTAHIAEAVAGQVEPSKDGVLPPGELGTAGCAK